MGVVILSAWGSFAVQGSFRVGFGIRVNNPGRAQSTGSKTVDVMLKSLGVVHFSKTV